jgi:hypothetical protein
MIRARAVLAVAGFAAAPAGVVTNVVSALRNAS